MSPLSDHHPVHQPEAAFPDHAPPDPAAPDGAPTVVEAPDEVAEFARAMQDYRRRSGRPFPTWSEVLEVLLSLGYAKPPGDASAAAAPPSARFRVRIARDGAEAEEIRRNLARFRGTPLARGPSSSFGFSTEADRESALTAIRAGYGWTSVEPED